MRMRHRIAVLVPIAIFVALVTISFWRPREPSYQGKSLSTWLKELTPVWPFDPGDSNKEAKGAIRHIGTNALPFLIDELRCRDSAFVRRMEWLNQKQSFLEVHTTGADERHARAAYGLEVLGPAAKPVLPSLIEILNDTNVSWLAAIALAAIGPEALPALTQALTNQNHEIRDAAMVGLGRMRAQAEMAVPNIVNCLKDSNRYVRLATVRSLVSIRKRLDDLTIPALIESLDDPDLLVRKETYEALFSFGREAKPAVPALFRHFENLSPAHRVMVEATRSNSTGGVEMINTLINGLKDTNTWVRGDSARLLGCCGDDAKAAIPALLDVLNDENSFNRDAAKGALKEIDPETAAKIGIR